MTAVKGKLSVILCSVFVLCTFGLSEAKRRIPIPISLLVIDARGEAIIKDAAAITRKADIFMEDYQFIKRIAIVEKQLNSSSSEGGIWNVDRCVFRNVTQNKRRDKQLAALQKSVRRTFGITWSKIRHSDLKRPLYSVLAARIFLEATLPAIPRGLRKQARLWVQKYHECAEEREDQEKKPQRWEELENKFVRVIKSSCLGGYVRCEHFCHEKRQGKTECSCKEGYKLQSDGASCSGGSSRSPSGTKAPAPARRTETESGCKNGLQCEHKCVTYRGVAHCACYDGYQLHEDGFSCVDIDECLFSPCSQLCTNTPGSFYCSCEQGFKLESDKITCKEIKELCSSNDISCTQNCKESGNCSCPSGTAWDVDSQSCVEVNECALFKGVCHQNCVNTPRGYRCTCTEGYKLHENGVSCSDIDECALGSHGCHHNCGNVPGSYFCSCRKGFRLSDDLKTCVDINECVLYPGICPAPSRCRNTIGGHKCDCPKGFTAHRHEVCVDENECEKSNGGCSQICTNLPGSYRCSCKYGYKLDSDRKTCSDIDECSRYSGLCQHRCVNTPGSYKCSCPPGQRQHPNFFVCMPM